jgi:hypothetical protein
MPGCPIAMAMATAANGARYRERKEKQQIGTEKRVAVCILTPDVCVVTFYFPFSSCDDKSKTRSLRDEEIPRPSAQHPAPFLLFFLVAFSRVLGKQKQK